MTIPGTRGHSFSVPVAVRQPTEHHPDSGEACPTCEHAYARHEGVKTGRGFVFGHQGEVVQVGDGLASERRTERSRPHQAAACSASPPDVFGAMAVLSADSWLDMTHKSMLYKYLDSIWPEAPNGPIAGNFWAEIVYNYSATYSPNVDNPPFFVDLPMAFPSGELRQDVWDRWLTFDPAVNWRDRIDNLKQLRGIMLDAGQKDDYNLHWGHRLLSHHLTEAGVQHVHTENPGNHGGRWPERYQVALEWLAGVLEHAGPDRSTGGLS